MGPSSSARSSAAGSSSGSTSQTRPWSTSACHERSIGSLAIVQLTDQSVFSSTTTWRVIGGPRYPHPADGTRHHPPMSLEEERERTLAEVAREVPDDRVLDALRAVPREAF